MARLDPPTPPDHRGGSLVNLMAEVEWRLTGSHRAPRLHPHLAKHIPDASTYVIVLMDGLGDHQLAHEAAESLAGARRAAIDAPFPTTTTVSLASVATATTPAEHGWLGHIIWLPELGQAINSLKWLGRAGTPIDVDTRSFLAAPNLWERLTAAGCEPITVQPGHFEGSPLSRAIYRGARFEPVWTTEEVEDATVAMAAVSGRLVFAYYPHIDFAAHVAGQASAEYREALSVVSSAWTRLEARLPDGAVMIGTADHGHIDYPAEAKHMIERTQTPGLDLFGDPRALYVRGPSDQIDALAASLPARFYPRDELIPWLGGSPTEVALARMPDGVFLADPGRLLLPGHMDKRLTGYHGGLDPRELEIPLLVGSS